MKPHNTQQHFLVDVYAVNEEGKDQYLGGGYFTALSQPDAEQAAFAHFWNDEWSRFGFEPAFHVDIAEHAHQHRIISHDPSTRQLVSELDAAIPFNEV